MNTVEPKDTPGLVREALESDEVRALIRKIVQEIDQEKQGRQ